MSRHACPHPLSPLWTLTTIAGLCSFSMAGCDAELGQSPEGNDSPSKGDESGDGDQLGDGESSLQEAALLHPLVRRLTRDELKHTLQDALGVSVGEADMDELPSDRPLEGFVNIATSQTVLPDHVEGYSQISEVAAAQLDWNSWLKSWGGCTEPTEACLGIVVNELGRILFRRPLHPEEQAKFTTLGDTILALDGATFSTASNAVMRAMLQSPQFLYRLENETASATGMTSGSIKTVGGYEMGTRLAYLVWGSGPDEELYAAAEDGRLDTIEGVSSELSRMLTDDARARRVTDRFMIDWGRLEALPDDGGLKSELTKSRS